MLISLFCYFVIYHLLLLFSASFSFWINMFEVLVACWFASWLYFLISFLVGFNHWFSISFELIILSFGVSNFLWYFYWLTEFLVAFLLAYWILLYVVCWFFVVLLILFMNLIASAFHLSLILKTSELKIIFYKIANNEVEILERLWGIILIWLYLILKENSLVNCVMNCFVVYLAPIIVFSQILHVFFEVSKLLRN